MNKKDIAKAFSTGNFEQTYPYLSERIVWNVIGENIFQGRSSVIDNCEKIAKYFTSIETDFKIEDVIATDNKVIVRGSGEFFKNGERINAITSCDVYEFDDNNELKTIYSYCISEEKQL